MKNCKRKDVCKRVKLCPGCPRKPGDNNDKNGSNNK